MRRALIAVALCSLALSACKSEDSPPPAPPTETPLAFEPPKPLHPKEAADPNFKPCNPYYPLIPGSSLKYTLFYSSGLVADMTVVVDQEMDNGRPVFVETTLTVDKSGGHEKLETTVRKFVCEGERVYFIAENSDNKVSNYRNLVETHFREPGLFVPEVTALKRKGTKWSYTYRKTFHLVGGETIPDDEPTYIGYEVRGETEVTVPAGKFKVVDVAKRVRDGIVAEYFAPGIGIVKRELFDGTRLDLKEYSGVSPTP